MKWEDKRVYLLVAGLHSSPEKSGALFNIWRQSLPDSGFF